jgi:hypothetical protein
MWKNDEQKDMKFQIFELIRIDRTRKICEKVTIRNLIDNIDIFVKALNEGKNIKIGTE